MSVMMSSGALGLSCLRRMTLEYPGIPDEPFEFPVAPNRKRRLVVLVGVLGLLILLGDACLLTGDREMARTPRHRADPMARRACCTWRRA